MQDPQPVTMAETGEDGGTPSSPLPWQVIGVVPVTGKGLLSCSTSASPAGPVTAVFRHDGTDGSRNFAKWVRKTLKNGPTLLCWDAPLTSAEFQLRSIERQARQWLRDLFTPDNLSRPIIRSAAARPHWIATQRILGLPVHEGMVIRGSLLQPRLICENQRPSAARRELYVTEVHPQLAIALHPAGRGIPWYRDNLETAWNYHLQAARLWGLGEDDLPLPHAAKLRTHDFTDAWVAMALGVLWLRGSGAAITGNRREGSFLLPHLAPAPPKPQD